jgi:kumamolisin
MLGSVLHNRLLAGAMLCLLPALPSWAATSLNSSALPFKPSVRVAEPAPATETVQLQISLRLRHKDELVARTQRGDHISAAELAQRYFPTEADHDSVIAWLRQSGLSIDRVFPSRLTIQFSGSAATVGAALGVHFSHIIADGARWTSSADTPRVPDTLSGIVLGVGGLHPENHPVPLHIENPLVDGKTPYYPSDLLTAYAVPASASTGTGATTAIVIDTFPKTSDLTKFWKTTGVAQSLSNIDLIQVNPGKLPAPGGEESLDTEITSSLAPSSKVRVYASQSLDNDLLDNDFQQIISDLSTGIVITQVSISLGECETDESVASAETDDQFFTTIEAMGATVFVSTGDSGARECSGSSAKIPSFYSTSPNVTAVGGTTLNLLSTGAWHSETAWDESGGGISRIFAKPSYQAKLSYAKRAVPDIAAVGNPSTGVLVILKGQELQYGGTSLSAPTWAGLMAIVNATRIAKGKAPLGALNSRLYLLVGTPKLHDITLGSNGYPAGKGYDLTTGNGSPAMGALLSALVSAK